MKINHVGLMHNLLFSVVLLLPAMSNAAQITKTINISGDVISTSGPKPAMNMKLISGSVVSNLSASWGWETETLNYGNTKVPENYLVGLFIRDSSLNRWHAFKVDSSPSSEASWATRVNRFRNTWPNGAINEKADRIFESGNWCLILGAASSESSGVFIPAPGSPVSCVSIP